MAYGVGEYTQVKTKDVRFRIPIDQQVLLSDDDESILGMRTTMFLPQKSFPG
jgi:hypothetical protein